MTVISPQPWHDHARELRAAGLRVQQIAERVGKCDEAVRLALNINGAADKYRQRVERMRAKKREAREAMPSAPVQRVTTITLPAVSLPPVLDEPRRFRIVPAIRATDSPGAERWRQEHLRLLRMGRIAQPGLVEELRQ